MTDFGLVPVEEYLGPVYNVPVSRKYDADRLTKEIEILQHIIDFYESNTTYYGKLLENDQNSLITLLVKLEKRATEKKTTIDEFVNCLIKTSGHYYTPVIYKTISHTIISVHKSYGSFIDIPLDKDLWKSSLIHDSEFNPSLTSQLPNFKVCDSLLSIEHTKEINDFIHLIAKVSNCEINFVTRAGKLNHIQSEVFCKALSKF
ncbi:unnamed protein product [Trichobilharzia szidati]|nr:unnamed protein product [Trichobilharzia szidati]